MVRRATEPDPRLAALEETHVRELTEFIREVLRTEDSKVPNVDPTDGGARARALFLLESPGRKAVASRFVSFDNPDASAGNMKKLLKFANIERNEVLLWNVFPYCVSTEQKNGNATRRQILDALPETTAFIDILRESLLVVVLCGRRAQWAAEGLKAILPNTVTLLQTFHPAARSYNQPKQRSDMERTFAEVAKIISRGRALNHSPSL